MEKYDDLVTVSVEDKTKNKSADEVTKEVKEGYLIFKDLEIVDDSKAHERLNKNNGETVIYYDRESGKFFVSKHKNDNNNGNQPVKDKIYTQTIDFS